MASALEKDDLKGQINPRNQYVAGSIVLLTVSLCTGMMFGFSAILLPQLEEEKIMTPKSEEASWIASVVNISQVLGSVLSGYFAGTIGRKLVIIISSAFMVIGWAFIGFSDGDYSLLMTGRLIHGFAFLASVSQVYLAEIADAQRRGILAGSGPLFVSSGITFVYILGAVLPWRWVCLVSAIFPAAAILLCKFIPETPTWLVHNGKIEEAHQVLLWLRGPNSNIDEEISELQVKQVITSKNEKESESGNLMTEMMKPSAYKPFILLMVMFILQQACGGFAVVFYAVNVFQDAGVAANPYLAAILTSFIRLSGTFLAALLVTRFSRKFLMVFSAAVMALSMLSLGASLQLKASLQESNRTIDAETNIFNVTGFTHNSNSNNTDESFFETESVLTALSILPIVEVISYMLTLGLGVGTIPWLLLGELCPIQVKGFASGVVACVASAVIFVVVKVFPNMILTLGTHGTYYLFGGICLIMFLFSIFFIPDTRGKTAAELHRLYDSKSNKEAHCHTNNIDCEAN